MTKTIWLKKLEPKWQDGKRWGMQVVQTRASPSDGAIIVDVAWRDDPSPSVWCLTAPSRIPLGWDGSAGDATRDASLVQPARRDGRPFYFRRRFSGRRTQRPSFLDGRDMFCLARDEISVSLSVMGGDARDALLFRSCFSPRTKY